MGALGKNYRPLCITNEGLLAYCREKLLLINVNTYEVRKLCDFYIEDPRKPFCFCNFGERLSHIYAYCGIAVEGGAIVAFNRGVYFVDTKTGEVKKEHSFRLQDMRRPLSFYEIKNVDNFTESVVYGEYSFNKVRAETKIWRRSRDGKWSDVYTFPQGCVRHIHSIIEDPYRNRVLIFTGDFGDECGIWESRDDFKNLKKIVGAEQKYRACCAKAYPDGIMIVTDSPFDQNYVYFMKEDEQGEVEFKTIAEIDGPAIFFTTYKDQLIFSTDVEYDESSVKGVRQYLSYKRGAGVKDWYVHLYAISQKDGIEEIKKYKKDMWPMVTLGFGQIAFPMGEVEGKIFLYPTAVKKDNQKLCCLIDNEGKWIDENS